MLSAAIPAGAAQVPVGDEPLFFSTQRRRRKLANPVSYDPPGAELPGDENVDPLAGEAGMSWPPIALAAARATAVRQPALGDHPQVLGEPDVGHSDLVSVFHGERVQPRGGR